MSISLIFVAILAFYLAFNLGANDVANAMGTSVGSKAVTLKQALIIAGVLEFTGAVLFGHEVTQTLATNVANPQLFINTPKLLLTGMVSVLIACGLWLQIATSRGLPVSSSHAVVGAIAGFSWVAVGVNAIDWFSIRLITIGWVCTPVISGVIAALFYSQIQRWILQQKNQITQLNEWIPWLSVALISTFGIIVLPTLTHPFQYLLIEKFGLQIPTNQISLFTGSVAVFGLTVYSWRQLAKVEKKDEPGEDNNQSIEKVFAKYQLLSACFVAFAHGSNDVGNAIAPLAAITYIMKTKNVPIGEIEIPLWILVLGAVGIVTGLAILGKNVIATIGESIITLQPSSGFCAELATATTILLASRLGLPVSTSHALVGGVVGIGLVQDFKLVKFSTLKNIAAAWLLTVPISAGLSAIVFLLMKTIFNF
ncbi:anion permease [Calothrix sp. UHCC 0171]|uniref:inorganic phosphate transporter n=1 Tax=Calothrix sp. UHCC 0171 TaxID=3110245 RepID=UPI002B1FCC9F|nr:anion permease [Calothrix sp. UHCC 0171]MEA5574265.1 inorganic phosphate transporter [Calothrix sp. UHCC 0171]